MLSCEGKITAEECAKILQSFQLNKAPGNDGIPVEFYIKFWPIISELLLTLPMSASVQAKCCARRNKL